MARKTPKPPLLVIGLEGGLVQWVLTDRKTSARVLVVDFDTEGTLDADLTTVPAEASARDDKAHVHESGAAVNGKLTRAYFRHFDRSN